MVKKAGHPQGDSGKHKYTKLSMVAVKPMLLLMPKQKMICMT